MGAPRIYETPEELSKCVDKWISKYVDSNGNFIESDTLNPPTVNGLTLFLGFAAKSSTYDYGDGNYGVDYSYPIKKALTIIEMWHERGLNSNSCTGHIFGLKNMGWKDRTETEHSGNISIAQQILEARKARD